MKTIRGTWAHGDELPEWRFEVFEGMEWFFEKPHQSPVRREAILKADLGGLRILKTYAGTQQGGAT
jgi:hypothetical protein